MHLLSVLAGHYLRSGCLVLFGALSLVDHRHEPSECLRLALAILLPEVDHLVDCEAAIVRFKVHQQPLDSQLQGV